MPLLLLLESFPPLQKHQHLNPDLHADYHDGDKSPQLGVRLNFIMYTHGVPSVCCISNAQTCLMSAMHQTDLNMSSSPSVIRLFLSLYFLRWTSFYFSFVCVVHTLKPIRRKSFESFPNITLLLPLLCMHIVQVHSGLLRVCLTPHHTTSPPRGRTFML